MEPQRDGLNFVPMLTQNLTPPSSARSRINLSKNRSQRSVVYYNGNYEGDSSMFSEKPYQVESLSLADTDSDTELFRDVTVIEAGKVKATNKNKIMALIWCLMQFLLVKFLKPQMSEKILKRWQHFSQSRFFHILTKFATIISIMMAYILYFMLVLSKNLLNLGRFFWKQRVIFYNIVRRLLWRLTLAKCSNLLLFFYVLISLPVLFALSLMGFVISICGDLKDVLFYAVHILKKI